MDGERNGQLDEEGSRDLRGQQRTWMPASLPQALRESRALKLNFDPRDWLLTVRWEPPKTISGNVISSSLLHLPT